MSDPRIQQTIGLRGVDPNHYWRFEHLLDGRVLVRRLTPDRFDRENGKPAERIMFASPQKCWNELHEHITTERRSRERLSLYLFNHWGLTAGLAAAARKHNRATDHARKICAHVGKWDDATVESVLRIVNDEKTRRLRSRKWSASSRVDSLLAEVPKRGRSM